MIHFITDYPQYEVDGVVADLKGYAVIPVPVALLQDGFAHNGLRDDQVTAFDEELAKALDYYLDAFGNGYTDIGLSSEFHIEGAIRSFMPILSAIHNITPELITHVRDHLFRTTLTHFDKSFMQKQLAPYIAYELSDVGRRKLKTEFFRHFRPRYNILIRPEEESAQ
jgi:hypothetical protein